MRAPDRFAVILYARTHHAVEFCFGSLVLGFLLLPTMASTRGITSWDGTATTPIAVAVCAALGILAATTWRSRGGQYEDALSTRRAAQVRAWHPVVVTLCTCTLAALAAVFVYGSAGRVATTGRSMLFWCALGFLGAGTARGYATWIAPGVYFMIVGVKGYLPSGDPHWWNIPMRAPGDVPAWILTGVLVAVSAIALWRQER